MKKILFCIDTLNKGGAEKALVNLLNFLVQSNKYDVHLLVLNKKYLHYLNEIDNRVINIKHRVPAFVLKYIIRIFPSNWLYKLFNRLNDSKYDYEVAFLEGSSTKVIAGSNKRSHKIAWIHCDFLENNWTKTIYAYLKNYEILTYKKFDNRVFVSNNSLKSFEKFSNINKENYVIHNLINREDILMKAKIKIDLEESLEKNKDYIVAIGRLNRVKGFAELIKCYGEENFKTTIPFNLLIIGDGEEKSNLEYLIKKYKLNGKVYLIPFLDNPYPVIKNSLALVSSSFSEALPTVFLEAFCLRTYVYSMPHSGAEELLGNNKNEHKGEIVYGDHDQLIKKIMSDYNKGILKSLTSRPFNNSYSGEEKSQLESLFK